MSKKNLSKRYQKKSMTLKVSRKKKMYRKRKTNRKKKAEHSKYKKIGGKNKKIKNSLMRMLQRFKLKREIPKQRSHTLSKKKKEIIKTIPPVDFSTTKQSFSKEPMYHLAKKYPTSSLNNGTNNGANRGYQLASTSHSLYRLPTGQTNNNGPLYDGKFPHALRNPYATINETQVGKNEHPYASINEIRVPVPVIKPTYMEPVQVKSQPQNENESKYVYENDWKRNNEPTYAIPTALNESFRGNGSVTNEAREDITATNSDRILLGNPSVRNIVKNFEKKNAPKRNPSYKTKRRSSRTLVNRGPFVRRRVSNIQGDTIQAATFSEGHSLPSPNSVLVMPSASLPAVVREAKKGVQQIIL